MVDISEFVEFGDDDDGSGGNGGGGNGGGGDAADFAALKDCLQALADAVASTNLAVINAAQGDPKAATARVQASVGALKRFHDAFKVLKDEEEPAEEDEE